MTNSELRERRDLGGKPYVIPNRFNQGEQVEVAHLPAIEHRFLLEVRAEGPSKHASISLECWLVGRSPAMTVTEGERRHIQDIGCGMGVSLQNERP